MVDGLERKIKVLIAKPGLDQHDRGAKVVALGLRDAGMEVIYTGLRQTSEEIVKIAIEEDVDVVGLSILSGAHMHFLPKVVELLRKEKVDVLVIGGGIVPPEDISRLKEIGIKEIFTPGTRIDDIVNFIKSNVPKKD